MPSDLKIALGNGGNAGVWYLTSSKPWFQPIDISLLPGPKPAFSPVDTVTVTYTGAELDAALLYFGRVANGVIDGYRTLDVVRYWDDVKNVQAIAMSAEKIFIDGLVHADVMVGTGSSAGSEVILNGAKRGNVITGAGDDVISIRMASNTNLPEWVDDFRIASGAGNDRITISGLDIAAEIAAGDVTFIRAADNNQPIFSSGQGRVTWIDAGAGNDVVVGWDSRDNIIGGADNGTIEVVSAPSPSGFAYSVGGATKGKGGHASFLYKIDLATGATTAVGEVTVSIGKFQNVSGLDVESLALNPLDNQLYGFVSKAGYVDNLIKIDPTTGATQLIDVNLAQSRSDAQDLSFDRAGNLFFVSKGDLFKVNLATGTLTTIVDDKLDSKIGALAIDPTSDRMFALAESGSRTIVYEIDKTDGKVLSSFDLDGVPKNSKIEGMSFDVDGNLYAVDRVSGKIALIDLDTHSATYISKTLGVSQQTGDGFEALAIGPAAPGATVGLKAIGGDVLTGGADADHFWYKAGDGVDTITDFQVGIDKLHFTGIVSGDVHVDVFDGSTYIRFEDASADGFVDNAMIVLHNVSMLSNADLLFA